MPLIKLCEICGTEFNTKPSHYDRRKTCSKECAGELKRNKYAGEGNPNFGNKLDRCVMWKGGRRISNYGYWLVLKPDHPNARRDGYILEHRYIMSEMLGRPLTDDEIVHHKDGNKLNNSPGNLELTDRSSHTSHHNKEFRIIRDENGRIKELLRHDDDGIAYATDCIARSYE